MLTPNLEQFFYLTECHPEGAALPTAPCTCRSHRDAQLCCYLKPPARVKLIDAPFYYRKQDIRDIRFCQANTLKNDCSLYKRLEMLSHH